MLRHTVPHASGHLWLRAAVSWLILTGPILLFPNLVAPGWLALWLSSAGTGALGLCAIGLARYRAVRLWGWCLVLTVAVSWFHHNTHDLAAASHFGGIAFGLLMMTVVGHITTSPRSRLVGFWVLVMAGAAVVVLGLFSLSAASVVAMKFERLGPWAVAVLSQLPNVTLNLPGLGDSGQVNANALGGTAAIVLPLAAGLIFAARRKNGTAPAWLLASVGICASAVVLLTVSLTLSRTAMGAVLCTVVIAGLRFRATRRWTVGAVIAAAAIAAVSIEPAGSRTPRAVARASVSLDTRLAIWRMGVERLKANPWTGVGISQFRDVAPYRIDGRTDLAHAHNIFLQTALDVGIPGLLAYIGLIGSLIWRGLSAAALRGAIPAVAVAASLSLLVTHLFGLLDAIALGAKVGAIQWACAGLILGASTIRHPGDSAPMTLLQRVLRSRSPKLLHPLAALTGYVLQKSGWSNRLTITRRGYVVPFFARSNVALTLWACPEYRDSSEELVAGWLRPGDTFVDVGANIGCLTALASRAVGDLGRVIALEPHPDTFACLLQTVAVNGCGNTTCHQVAAGNRAGSAGLTNERRKDDNSRISTDQIDSVVVPMVPLADVLNQARIERIDLLKIDVEGFEAAVVAGLAGFTGHIRGIYLECIDENLRKYGSSEVDLLRLLNEHGFVCVKDPHDETNLICEPSPHRTFSI